MNYQLQGCEASDYLGTYELLESDYLGAKELLESDLLESDDASWQREAEDREINLLQEEQNYLNNQSEV